MNNEIKENNETTIYDYKFVSIKDIKNQLQYKKIKEILDKAKEISDYGADGKQHTRMFNQFEAKALLDYITNLQEENERLKETNVYCNRTDCVGRIKDSRKYDSVYQEKEDYKTRIDKAIEFVKKESKKCYTNQTSENPLKVIGNFMWHTDKLLDILQGKSDE